MYEVYKSGRIPFYANAGADIYAFRNDPIILNALNIGEPAAYNWYDPVGNLVFSGMNFPTFAHEEQEYKLEIIAESDGYKDYDEVWVKIVPGKIESIHPNPATNYVEVTCVYNNVSSAFITISDQSGRIYAN